MYDQDFFNRIQLSEFFLQILTMIWAMDDVTNTGLLEELQKQNEEYLKTIIEQNNEILKKLADLG